MANSKFSWCSSFGNNDVSIFITEAKNSVEADVEDIVCTLISAVSAEDIHQKRDSSRAKVKNHVSQRRASCFVAEGKATVT